MEHESIFCPWFVTESQGPDCPHLPVWVWPGTARPAFSGASEGSPRMWLSNPLGSQMAALPLLGNLYQWPGWAPGLVGFPALQLRGS